MTPGLTEDLSHGPGLFPTFNSVMLAWFWGDSSMPYVGVSPEPSWIPPGPMARTVLLVDVLPAWRLGVGSGIFPPLGKEGVGQKEVYVGRGVVAVL